MEVLPTTRWRLCLLALLGALLLAGSGASATQAAGAAATDRLVFKSDWGHGGWFAMDANGTNVRVLRAPFDKAEYVAWSPDASHVAYTAGSSGLPLFVMRSDGTERVKVTNGVEDKPAWSPDGTLLAYQNFADNRTHVARASGKPVASFDGWFEGWAGNDRLMLIDSGDFLVVDLKSGKKVLDLPDVANVSEDQFQWSPSGTSLAYLSDSQDTLCLVNADGSGRRCVEPALDDVSLAWSSQGDRIAVANYPQLSIVDPKTLQVRTIADIEPYATDLTWSSDAARLAFVVGRDIGVVGSGGTGLRRIRSPGGQSDPRWVPAARLSRFEGPRATPVQMFRVSGRTLHVHGVVAGLAAEGARVAVLTHDTPDHCDHVVIWQPGRKGYRKFGTRDDCGSGWSSPVLAGGLAGWVTEGISNSTHLEIQTSGRGSLASAEYHNGYGGGAGSYLGNLVGGGGLLAWNEWSQLANDSTIRDPSLKAWYHGQTRLVRGGPDSVPVLAADGTHLLVRAKGSLALVGVDGKILRRFPAQQQLRAARLNGDDVVVISAGKLVDFDLATGKARRTWNVPATSVLADVQSGVAALVVGRSISLVDLRSGRRTALPLSTARWPVAQLEPDGLFYGYGTAESSWVRLLPFADIRKGLGR